MGTVETIRKLAAEQALESALVESLERLSYVEAINGLIGNVASAAYASPEATEEQRKQLEVLAQAQEQTLTRLHECLNVAREAVWPAPPPAENV